MISVGSRDGRIGLGFDGGMEETELEEGEACCYNIDSTIDPDVSLSYLVSFFFLFAFSIYHTFGVIIEIKAF